MSEEAVDLRAAVEAGEPEAKPDVVEVKQDWSAEEAQEAEAMGWIPPERAKKLPEGKSYVGPKEFMERNPLYRQMKDLKTSFGQLEGHYQKVAEKNQKEEKAAYEAKIEALESEKITALDEANHKRVGEIDKELRTTEKPVEQKNTDSTLKDWVSDGNDWYEKDSFLQLEADLIGERLYSDTLYGKDLLNEVKGHLKQKYPEKFSNPNRERPSAVEGSTNAPGPKSKTTSAKDLTKDEKAVFSNFKNMGVFSAEGSEQKYLNEVIALRD